jgi:hypothetical protein
MNTKRQHAAEHSRDYKSATGLLPQAPAWSGQQVLLRSLPSFRDALDVARAMFPEMPARGWRAVLWSDEPVSESWCTPVNLAVMASVAVSYMREASSHERHAAAVCAKLAENLQRWSKETLYFFDLPNFPAALRLARRRYDLPLEAWAFAGGMGFPREKHHFELLPVAYLAKMMSELAAIRVTNRRGWKGRIAATRAQIKTAHQIRAKALRDSERKRRRAIRARL